VNQEESEQDEVDELKKGADSTGDVMHIPPTTQRLSMLVLVDCKAPTKIALL